jgi:hypothetical protein
MSKAYPPHHTIKITKTSSSIKTFSPRSPFYSEDNTAGQRRSKTLEMDSHTLWWLRQVLACPGAQLSRPLQQ